MDNIVVNHKPKRILCGKCVFGGKTWKGFKGTNLHCEHPDRSISSSGGWPSLRDWYDTCENAERKQQ